MAGAEASRPPSAGGTRTGILAAPPLHAASAVSPAVTATETGPAFSTEDLYQGATGGGGGGALFVRFDVPVVVVSPAGTVATGVTGVVFVYSWQKVPVSLQVPGVSRRRSGALRTRFTPKRS